MRKKSHVKACQFGQSLYFSQILKIFQLQVASIRRKTSNDENDITYIMRNRLSNNRLDDYNYILSYSN